MPRSHKHHANLPPNAYTRAHAEQMAATAFLRQFAEDTSSSSQRSLLIVCLWLAITLGRVVGLRDQLTLTLARLYRHVGALCAGAATTMFLLLVSSRTTAVLWITVIVFGLFTGPALGYGYDLSTRVSPSPATSTLVAEFGITAGGRYGGGGGGGALLTFLSSDVRDGLGCVSGRLLREVSRVGLPKWVCCSCTCSLIT